VSCWGGTYRVFARLWFGWGIVSLLVESAEEPCPERLIRAGELRASCSSDGSLSCLACPGHAAKQWAPQTMLWWGILGISWRGSTTSALGRYCGCRGASNSGGWLRLAGGRAQAFRGLGLSLGLNLVRVRAVQMVARRFRISFNDCWQWQAVEKNPILEGRGGLEGYKGSLPRLTCENQYAKHYARRSPPNVDIVPSI
jgi:hypothetical protein